MFLWRLGFQFALVVLHGFQEFLLPADECAATDEIVAAQLLQLFDFHAQVFGFALGVFDFADGSGFGWQ